MDRTSRTHFGMDERGLGGTHMIQQQFLHMFRRIQAAQKQVDNDPPATGLFQRHSFNQFGEYWKRVQPMSFDVPSKVDHAPPASYPLLEDLYINQPSKPAIKRNQRGAAAPKGRSHDHAPLQPRPEDLVHAQEIEGVALSDMPESMITYLTSIHSRKQQVARELEAIRRKRLLAAAPAASRHDESTQLHEGAGVPSVIATLARDTLRAIDAERDRPHAPQALPSSDSVDAGSTLRSNCDSRAAAELAPTVEADSGHGSNQLRSSANSEVLSALASLVMRAPTDGSPVDLQSSVDIGGQRSPSSRAEQTLQRESSTVLTVAKCPSALKPPQKSGMERVKSGVQLNPALLAAAAPKKLALKATSPSSGRSPSRENSSSTSAANLATTAQAAAALRIPHPPVLLGGKSAARGGVSDMDGIRLPNTRYAVSDSSMAGHHFKALEVPLFGTHPGGSVTLHNGARVAPPTKVIGLINEYVNEDAATSDDHHSH